MIRAPTRADGRGFPTQLCLNTPPFNRWEHCAIVPRLERPLAASRSPESRDSGVDLSTSRRWSLANESPAQKVRPDGVTQSPEPRRASLASSVPVWKRVGQPQAAALANVSPAGRRPSRRRRPDASYSPMTPEERRRYAATEAQIENDSVSQASDTTRVRAADSGTQREPLRRARERHSQGYEDNHAEKAASPTGWLPGRTPRRVSVGAPSSPGSISVRPLEWRRSRSSPWELLLCLRTAPSPASRRPMHTMDATPTPPSVTTCTCRVRWPTAAVPRRRLR
jgi:hypothetical protein